MDIMWENASGEVKSVYGKDYLEAVYTGTVEAAKESAKTTAVVIDCMEDAVTNLRPRIRYLVDGSCKLIDLNNVSYLNVYQQEMMYDTYHLLFNQYLTSFISEAGHFIHLSSGSLLG